MLRLSTIPARPMTLIRIEHTFDAEKTIGVTRPARVRLRHVSSMRGGSRR
jgi:hypothetical protein